MGYLYVRDSPMREQWERNQNDVEDRPDNCGPTATAKALDYVQDYWHSINSVRRASGVLSGPVTYDGDLRSLKAFGVSAYIARPSVSEIKTLLLTARRPVLLGLDMGQLPAAIRDHPFLGMHLVCAMENDIEGGVPGIRYMDPNFNTYTGRVDPDRGYKFMPDWALQRSFRHRHPDGRIVPGFAIVVTSPKPLPKTSSPLPKLPLYVADGDPTPMRMRSLVNSDTGAVKLLKLKPGKPYRGGYLVTSPVKKNANSVTGDLIAAVSYIDKDDLPTSERIFGDVFVVPTYQTNGDHFMYVKSVDTVAR